MCSYESESSDRLSGFITKGRRTAAVQLQETGRDRIVEQIPTHTPYHCSIIVTDAVVYIRKLYNVSKIECKVSKMALELNPFPSSCSANDNLLEPRDAPNVVHSGFFFKLCCCCFSWCVANSPFPFLRLLSQLLLFLEAAVKSFSPSFYPRYIYF